MLYAPLRPLSLSLFLFINIINFLNKKNLEMTGNRTDIDKLNKLNLTYLFQIFLFIKIK